QQANLLVQDGPEFLQGQVIACWAGAHETCLSFSLATCLRLHPRPQRDAPGDPMKPASHRLLALDRPHPPRQNQKRCLQRILGLMGIMKYPPTDAKDHGAMAPNKVRERTLIPMDQIAIQKLAVRQIACAVGRTHTVDEAQDFTER